MSGADTSLSQGPPAATPVHEQVTVPPSRDPTPMLAPHTHDELLVNQNLPSNSSRLQSFLYQ